MLGTPAQFVKEYGVGSLARGCTMTIGRESMVGAAMGRPDLAVHACGRRLLRSEASPHPHDSARSPYPPLYRFDRLRAPPPSKRAQFTMAMLGITPLIQRQLVESGTFDKNTALAAGSLTGACFAGTITHPMDTIKTCMQGDLGNVKYKGIMQTGSLLAEEYGVVQGLFKGLTFRIALVRARGGDAVSKWRVGAVTESFLSVAMPLVSRQV